MIDMAHRCLPDYVSILGRERYLGLVYQIQLLCCGANSHENGLIVDTPLTEKCEALRATTVSW